MARKPDAVRTQFRIPPALNEKIDKFADDHNLSKNQAMVLLIERGLAEQISFSPEIVENDADYVEALIKEIALKLKKRKGIQT